MLGGVKIEISPSWVLTEFWFVGLIFGRLQRVQICKAVFKGLFWSCNNCESNMRIGIILILKSGNGEILICTFVIIRPLCGEV